MSPQELAQRTVERRAVEAAIGGLPLFDKTWTMTDIEETN